MENGILWWACVLVSVSICSVALADPIGDQGRGWVNISDPITKQLTDAGVKIPWPGDTAGVACDRLTGRLFMEVAGVGLWASDDHGDTFKRIAEGEIGGRCEFGYAMNADPAGSRLACFMLDGKAGMTMDGGQSWQEFAPMKRNWDYGAVDWTDPQARAIFASRHEFGGEVYLSSDGGASWESLGKHPEFTGTGIFDARTLVAGREDGIVRSTDGGKTWDKISDLHPVGRVAVAFKGTTYWLAKEGLIVSSDKGASWRVVGSGVGAVYGPLFGKDESQIIVADFHGFLRSGDGGVTWRRIASMPTLPVKAWTPKHPGQWLSIAWDPRGKFLYVSGMGNPTWRMELRD